MGKTNLWFSMSSKGSVQAWQVAAIDHGRVCKANTPRCVLQVANRIGVVSGESQSKFGRMKFLLILEVIFSVFWLATSWFWGIISAHEAIYSDCDSGEGEDNDNMP